MAGSSSGAPLHSRERDVDQWIRETIGADVHDEDFWSVLMDYWASLGEEECFNSL